MEQKIKLHNRWDIVKTNIKTGKQEIYKGENIVLNQFWTRYIHGTYNSTCLSYIFVGSGTTAPVATNTGLGTRWAYYASANSTIDRTHYKTDGYITRQLSCRIEANTYVGQTLSEVGFAYGTTATNLTTHALIKDMNGNALSITIGADEVIDVYGTVFFKFGYDINGGTVRIVHLYADSEYFFNGLLCVSAWAGELDDNQSGYSKYSELLPASNQPYGNYLDSAMTANRTNTYDAAAKKLTMNMPDSIASANNLAGGIGSLFFSGVQVKVPCTGFAQPVITKESLGTGNGTTKDYQTAFGRILNNSTAKAYVNDVEVSATFDYLQPYPIGVLTDVNDVFIYSNDSNLWAGQLGQLGVDCNYCEFENPQYATLGITSFSARYVRISTSDDGTNWTEILTNSSTSNSATLTVPAANKYQRYWKIEPFGTANTTWGLSTATGIGTALNTNVHLAAAPANGDTVSITYQPDVIAKDAAHILKGISMALTFAEYTPT